MAVKETNHRVTVTLTDEQYEWLMDYKDELDLTSVSKAVSTCMDSYVSRSYKLDLYRKAVRSLLDDLLFDSYMAKDFSTVHFYLGIDDDSTYLTLVRDELRYMFAEIGAVRCGLSYEYKHRRAQYHEWCERVGETPLA